MKKRLVRRSFHSYIMSCLKLDEDVKEPLEFPITEIINRNPDQVPDELWYELIIKHVIHIGYN